MTTLYDQGKLFRACRNIVIWSIIHFTFDMIMQCLF